MNNLSKLDVSSVPGRTPGPRPETGGWSRFSRCYILPVNACWGEQFFKRAPAGCDIRAKPADLFGIVLGLSLGFAGELFQFA